MTQERDRQSMRSRRVLAGTAATLALGIASAGDEASAGRDQVRKHRIKDIKRELQQMGTDVAGLEALAETLGNISGAEELEVEARRILWNVDSKRRLALSI
jgi:hypothetical protein